MPPRVERLPEKLKEQQSNYPETYPGVPEVLTIAVDSATLDCECVSPIFSVLTFMIRVELATG